MDLDEYIARCEKLKPNGKGDHIQHLEMVRRSAVEADYLTGHQHWDWFLSIIQPLVDSAESLVDAIKESLVDPRISDEQQVRNLRSLAAVYIERAAVLRAIMDLPKKIVEDGVNAKLELDEHDAP